MRKRMLWLMVVAILAIGGPVTVAGVSRCAQVAAHIRDVVAEGDLPAAKLLVDTALQNPKELGCFDEECATLTQLRRDVYTACANDLLRIAADDLRVREDGRVAIRHILMAEHMANTVGLRIRNANYLVASALFYSGCQDLDDAEVAEQEGDLVRSDELRAIASDSFYRAALLDTRVAALIVQLLKELNLEAMAPRK